jgi:hypothetical protein
MLMANQFEDKRRASLSGVNGWGLGHLESRKQKAESRKMKKRGIAGGASRNQKTRRETAESQRLRFLGRTGNRQSARIEGSLLWFPGLH